MAGASQERLVRRLLDIAGSTYAQEAGVRLKNKPMPEFELLILCMLASKPIDATIATRGARELVRTGVRTPNTAVISVSLPHIAATTSRWRNGFDPVQGNR